MHAVVAFLTGGLLAATAFFGHAVQPAVAFIQDSVTAPFETTTGRTDENAIVPTATTTTKTERVRLPQNTTALGPYNILIADRGNNRVIEVTPQKKIVWHYDFKGLALGTGADDAFFADQGRTVMMSLENYHLIEQVDYATRKIEWRYGTPGRAGAHDNQLNTPDDAYKRATGNVIVSDIKNCRIMELSPKGTIIHQYGNTGRCGTGPGLLSSPNGDTPLANGHILISEIGPHDIVELDQNWKFFARYPLPISYPSDPQPMKNGDILVANYRNPGALIELNPKTSKVVWKFAYTTGTRRLNKPSLAIEMPNGIILTNDDLNHRVIAIDKTTNRIVWQYGVTHKPGNAPGQLNIPDGLDIIQRATSTPVLWPSTNLPVYTVGHVMQLASYFSDTVVQMHGYVLANTGTTSTISDEASGPLTHNDLPVRGALHTPLARGTQYLFRGTLIHDTTPSANGNYHHLQLLTDPVPYH